MESTGLHMDSMGDGKVLPQDHISSTAHHIKK